MIVKISGNPDDLIQRCDTCEYCIFEEILLPEQRKIKILSSEIPEDHMHRIIIEQLCGRNYDDVCPMKYAAMRASCDDRTAMQLGVIKNYVWDLGKKHKQRVEFNQALSNWTRVQDLGRKIEESYAKRYDEIWEKGIRKIEVDGKTIKKQIFTSDYIYEVIMLESQMYLIMIVLLDSLLKEHKERDSI